MAFYLLLILVATLFATVANRLKHDTTLCLLFYMLSAVVLLVPLAMRDCGVDYDDYYLTFLSTANRTWNNYWSIYNGRPEPLYSVLNYLAYYNFHSYQGVHVLCAVISIAFSYAGIYKLKDSINLGIAIWSFGFSCYLMMYGLNRMMIAVSIVIWTYHYWLDKRPTLFFIWIMVAGLFHYSAFLMIPFYLITNMLEKNRFSLSTLKWERVALSILLVFVVIYQIVPRIFGHYPWFVRYEQYFILSFTIEALNNNIHTYPTIILSIIFRNAISTYLKDKTLLNMLYIYTSLCIVSIIMPVHRICYYFYPCVIILNSVIPNAGFKYEWKENNAQKYYFLYLVGLAIVGVFEIWLMTCYSTHWAPFINPYKIGHLT